MDYSRRKFLNHPDLPPFPEDQIYGFLLMEFLEEHPDLPLNNVLALQPLTGMNNDEFNKALTWLVDNSLLDLDDRLGEYVQ